jgi:predicted lipid-binding transport protein (Tim44 family)
MIDSLISGSGFSGFGLMDIVIIGLAIYLLLKIFGRKRTTDKTMPPYPGKSEQPSIPPGLFSNYKYDPMGQNGQKTDRPASLGGFNWDMLASRPQNATTPAAPSAANIPLSFDQQEFLRGAKMAYQRLNESWDKRDVDDISRFATQSFMQEINKRVKEDPQPSVTEIMLVNASLIGLKTENIKETATVLFDVLLRENAGQPTPSSVKEVWHFTRAANSAETWKLDGIQQVK